MNKIPDTAGLVLVDKDGTSWVMLSNHKRSVNELRKERAMYITEKEYFKADIEKLRKENEQLSKAYESLVFIGGKKLADPVYQCCNCKIEIKDLRVVVPEKNEVWCVECFYKNWKIIT